MTELHLPDLEFIRLCENRYGINRGVYNTIDMWFFEQGLKDIILRRKTILSFLDTNANLQPFGHGGLSAKLKDYFNGICHKRVG